MLGIGKQETHDADAKLRITAALLHGAAQKDLGAAYHRVNPQTEFDLARAYKWIGGCYLPRSPHMHEDWAKELELGRPAMRRPAGAV